MSPKNDDPQVQTGIRFPRSLFKRADSLAESMSQPGMRMKRADVIRLAVFKGIELFEKERSDDGERKAKR